jgi:hypothetical protein
MSGSAAFMLAFVLTFGFGCGKETSSVPKSTQTAPTSPASASVQAPASGANGGTRKAPEFDSEETNGLRYSWSVFWAYKESGGVGVLTSEALLGEPYSATPRDLQELGRVNSARGWPSVMEDQTLFAPELGKGASVLAKWGTNSLAYALYGQDVAYSTAGGEKKALRVLTYRGCPIQINALKAEPSLSLREPNEIKIESADGRILIPQKDSLVPFLATDSEVVYLCWNAQGSSIRFLHAGTIFQTDSGRYKVSTDGACISFDIKKGVILDGIEKVTKQH